MEAFKVIKKFLATEKSTIAREEGKYSFEVDRRANKYHVKHAIEELFEVEVDSVRTLIMPGKIKRMGRFEGKTPTWKKAIIKLKGDATIAEFENM
ncbi:MAG: 50S ribosomal protein L23 [candidate division Zixibacteria bacterium]|nr:50S ribosomal protein L23 [candidate division Zixibacteria bacterium]